MQNFRSPLNKSKRGAQYIRGIIGEWLHDMRPFLSRLLSILTVLAFIVGLIALVVLIWLQVRPVKTADIKVPVATDQASYSPGEEISGIFFGDTYYTGNVKVLREVFCKNYKGVIKPPPESADGDLFSTIGKPRHLEGQNIVVGNLPANVPVGSNCVLQFSNNYEIQTLFGVRHVEYQYYTQNFSIVTAERRAQLDCEASGRKDCNFLTGDEATTPNQQSVQSSPETQQVSPGSTDSSSRSSNSTTNNSTTNNTTTNNSTNPAEPAPRYEEQCTVNVIGIKAFCREVQVQ